jgi:phage terminase large subunit-like protein
MTHPDPLTSAVLAAGEEEMRALVAALPEAVLRRWHGEWAAWAHAGQLEPPGDWRVWVMRGGRGFGKTRGGAEWVRGQALARPGLRIALVAASIDEARAVMVEGRSGLLGVSRPGDGLRFERSRRRLVWANGSEARLFSGGHGEGLRGPEHHLAWCDELAKWRQGKTAWDNLMLGLRAGERPRALVTTTPRPGTVLSAILDAPGVVVTGGPTAANPHLPAAFVEAMTAALGGTRLGRQELDGELIEDVEGALWTRALIEACRVASRPSPSGDGMGVGLSIRPVSSRLPHPNPSPEGEGLRRVVVGVDPPASAAGTCGIVACGVDARGTGFVLEDASAGGLSPEGWARAVAGAAARWRADRVVAEANQGGEMVRAVLRSASVSLPLRLVHASRGKAARAEPVAALFEAGRARFAGAFPALEDQLAAFTAGGYAGPGSPDRADAMVWALTALMLEVAPEPRILGF